MPKHYWEPNSFFECWIHLLIMRPVRPCLPAPILCTSVFVHHIYIHYIPLFFPNRHPTGTASTLFWAEINCLETENIPDSYQQTQDEITVRPFLATPFLMHLGVSSSPLCLSHSRLYLFFPNSGVHQKQQTHCFGMK